MWAQSSSGKKTAPSSASSCSGPSTCAVHTTEADFCCAVAFSSFTSPGALPNPRVTAGRGGAGAAGGGGGGRAATRATAPEGANECTFEQWVAAQNGDVVMQNNDFVVPIMDGLGLAIVVTRS